MLPAGQRNGVGCNWLSWGGAHTPRGKRARTRQKHTTHAWSATAQRTSQHELERTCHSRARRVGTRRRRRPLPQPAAVGVAAAAASSSAAARATAAAAAPGGGAPVPTTPPSPTSARCARRPEGARRRCSALTTLLAAARAAAFPRRAAWLEERLPESHRALPAGRSRARRSGKATRAPCISSACWRVPDEASVGVGSRERWKVAGRAEACPTTTPARPVRDDYGEKRPSNNVYAP